MCRIDLQAAAKVCGDNDWADVKFCKNDEEPKLVIDGDSKEWLDEFLYDVWEQYQTESASMQGRS